MGYNATKNQDNTTLQESDTVSSRDTAAVRQNDELTILIQRLSEEGIASLDSPELLDEVSNYLFELYHNGNMDQALLLLERLGETALSGNIRQRERAITILSHIAEKILSENNEDLLEAVAHLLVRWLKEETEFVAGFEFISIQLSRLIGRMLEAELWYQAEDLLSSLQLIRTGSIPKSRIFRQIISRSHKIIADEKLLKMLTDTFVTGNGNRAGIAEKLLVHLGDYAIPHLLQTLLFCQERAQRFRLLELIPQVGTGATPYLIKELEKNPPWYFTRNLLCLLSRIADPSQYQAVKPYLSHQDIRIEKEAIEYLGKIPGEMQHEYLHEALNLCSDALKPELIRKLEPLRDEKITILIIDLLYNLPSFAADQRDAIAQEICDYLAAQPNPSAAEPLEDLLLDSSLQPPLAERTVARLEKCLTALQKTARPRVPEHSGKSAQQPATAGHFAEEDASEKQTMPQWLKHICAKEDTTEELKKHLALRKDFYIQLTHAEFLVFSSLLTHMVYGENEVITAIGDVHSLLFFIDEGTVLLSFPDDEKEKDIRRLEKGDIFGHDIFMDGSEWGVSLTAACRTEVVVFDQEQLLRLQAVYPDLCKLLLEYCKKNGVSTELQPAGDKLPSEMDAATAMLTDEMGGELAAVQVDQLSAQGFTYSFVVPDGLDQAIFTDKTLAVSLKSNVDETRVLRGKVEAVKFSPEEKRLRIEVRFGQEEKIEGFSLCTISL